MVCITVRLFDCAILFLYGKRVPKIIVSEIDVIILCYLEYSILMHVFFLMIGLCMFVENNPKISKLPLKCFDIISNKMWNILITSIKLSLYFGAHKILHEIHRQNEIQDFTIILTYIV